MMIRVNRRMHDGGVGMSEFPPDCWPVVDSEGTLMICRDDGDIWEEFPKEEWTSMTVRNDAS